MERAKNNVRSIDLKPRQMRYSDEIPSALRVWVCSTQARENENADGVGHFPVRYLKFGQCRHRLHVF